jgi:hypothetical protein
VQADSFYEGTIKKFFLKLFNCQFREESMRGIVADLVLNKFRYYLLSGQSRVAPMETDQLTLINAINVIKPGFPFNANILQILQRRVIRVDQLDQFHPRPYITFGNAERYMLQYYLSLKEARRLNVPFITWDNEITSPSNIGSSLASDALQSLYEQEKCLTAIFYYGCPGYLNGNDKDRAYLKTKLGIVNGANVEYRGLIFSARDQNREVVRRVRDANPREFSHIHLGVVRPVAIKVALVNLSINNWPRELSLSSTEVVVAISCKSHEGTLKHDKRQFIFRLPGVEPAHAVTTYKMEGRTVKLFGLFLNYGGKLPDMEDMVVAITRAASINHWLIYPMGPGETLSHLSKLHYRDSTIIMNACINKVTHKLDLNLFTTELKDQLSLATKKAIMEGPLSQDKFARVESSFKANETKKGEALLLACTVQELKLYSSMCGIKLPNNYRKQQIIDDLVVYLSKTFSKVIINDGVVRDTVAMNLGNNPTVSHSDLKIGRIVTHAPQLINDGNRCYVNSFMQVFYSALHIDVIGKNEIYDNAASLEFKLDMLTLFRLLQNGMRMTPFLLNIGLVHKYFSYIGQQDDATVFFDQHGSNFLEFKWTIRENIFPQPPLSTGTDDWRDTIYSRDQNVWQWEMIPPDLQAIFQQLYDVGSFQEVSSKESIITSLNLPIMPNVTFYNDARQPVSVQLLMNNFFNSVENGTLFALRDLTNDSLVGYQKRSRKMTIVTYPKWLSICVKIFSFGVTSSKIIPDYGYFVPLELLVGVNMTKTYILWGIVCHAGSDSVNSGHYISYIRSSLRPTLWVKCDDAVITTLRDNEKPPFCYWERENGANTSQPYMLFYRDRDNFDDISLLEHILAGNINNQVGNLTNELYQESIGIDLDSCNDNIMDIENEVGCGDLSIQSSILQNDAFYDKWHSYCLNLKMTKQEWDTFQLCSHISCDNDVVAKFDSEIITARGFRSLHGSKWVSVEVVNAYMALFRSTFPNCCFVPSSWYSVLVDSVNSNSSADSNLSEKIYKCFNGKQFSLSRYDFVVWPLDGNNSHWTFVVIDMRQKTICHYDGYGDNSNQGVDLMKIFLQFVQGWFVRNSQYCQISEWTILKGGDRREIYPKQVDSYNCGPILIMAIYMIIKNIPFHKNSFSISNMRLFRQWLSSIILRSQIPDEFK